MKVALVVPDLDGAGAQRVMLDLAAGMVERGVEVDVVAVRGEGPLRRLVPPGATVVDLGARRAVSAVAPLVGYLRRARPDAVVSCLNHVNLVTIAATRVARTGAIVMVTQHNQLSSSAPRKDTRRARAMPALLRVGFRFADRVVAVSDGVADDLARTIGLARNRIAVIYNPVDVARLRAAAAAPTDVVWPDGDGAKLLGVGRLIEQKDFPNLLRALAALPTARLVLLGDGEDRVALGALAAELGVAARVCFAGFVDNPFPVFAAADVFVLSSRWEGLPTVLIEALALSPHVVATDCPSGPREILDGGRWGHLVPVGDPAALAEAIAACVTESPVEASEALARYDRATVTTRYLELLAT
ncbi:MAG TPA: glycosyltransferase [Acidimicrobiales bacterium]|nr:glycosyltransferase [Acidimicrobiales bacterium]